MTPKRKPACVCCGRPRSGISFCLPCGYAYSRANAGGSSVADTIRWVAERTARLRKAPMPSAVRELLRDVVLWHRTEDDINPGSEDMANRAERILGVPWERIVAKARKAGRR